MSWKWRDVSSRELKFGLHVHERGMTCWNQLREKETRRGKMEKGQRSSYEGRRGLAAASGLGSGPLIRGIGPVGLGSLGPLSRLALAGQKVCKMG